MRRFLCISVGLLASVILLQAQTIAQWTFESSGPSISGTAASFTGVTPEVGSGSASGIHASSSTVWSSPAGNGSVESFSVNTWAVGDYWLFEVNTLGYNNVGLSWDQTSSGTGPKDFNLDYSLNSGGSWANINSYSVLANASPNPTWNSSTYNSIYTFTVNLGGVADNQSSVWFRLIDTSTVSANGGTVAAGGTDRVDNFTVAVIPEPTTLSLLGGFALLAIARRKK